MKIQDSRHDVTFHFLKMLLSFLLRTLIHAFGLSSFPHLNLTTPLDWPSSTESLTQLISFPLKKSSRTGPSKLVQILIPLDCAPFVLSLNQYFNQNE